jgi:hypothetical protein
LRGSSGEERGASIDIGEDLGFSVFEDCFEMLFAMNLASEFPLSVDIDFAIGDDVKFVQFRYSLIRREHKLFKFPRKISLHFLGPVADEE